MKQDTPKKIQRKNSPRARVPILLLQQVPAEEIGRVCGVTESTATRWRRGLATPPKSAVMLLTLHVNGLAAEAGGGGFESSRQRAAALRVRMLQFHNVYNAAWFVRAAEHGNPSYRRAKMGAFADMLRKELENCQDQEALIYAVADALTAYPRGCPWER